MSTSIPFQSGRALLFGDEIPALYWIAAEDFAGGYVLTWLYMPEATPDYPALIASLPAGFFTDTNCSATCSDQGFLLFPATQAPLDDEYFERIKVSLPAGTYTAALGIYETPDTSLRIIKIQLQGPELS